jgi:type IV pilus assembly protein PilO
MKPKAGSGNGAAALREWLKPLNLHWAGVGLLALVNVYLLVQMGLLWHARSNYNADAQAEQRIELKTAEVAATPLRGLDAKLGTATAESDRFYRDRLPGSDSEMLAEIGALAKKTGVRLIRAQYVATPVMPGTSGELTEVRIDATLGGDYRPLVMMMNSLERDKMFFVIKAVTLTGQQTGNVNLRLRLVTYQRPGGNGEPVAGATGEEPRIAEAGGPGR